MLNTQKADNRQYCSVAGLYGIWGAYAVLPTFVAAFGYGKLAEDVLPQSTASAPTVVIF